jgi:hypothetical protein
MTRTTASYDTDFFAWTREQAAALRELQRSRWNGPLDLANLAEEMEDLGKEQRNAVRSWLLQIMIHLLLLRVSRADSARPGWMDEIDAARDSIEARLSPSLRRDLERQAPAIYVKARRRAISRLERYGEPQVVSLVRESAPFTLDEVLCEGWYPGQAPG